MGLWAKKIPFNEGRARYKRKPIETKRKLEAEEVRGVSKNFGNLSCVEWT
jgi:hypothetical protein